MWAEQAFGRWFAGGLYWGLVRLQRRLYVPNLRAIISFVSDFGNYFSLIAYC